MEKLDSEYPTSGQVNETLEAYRKGSDALMDLLRKRRVAEPDNCQRNELGQQ